MRDDEKEYQMERGNRESDDDDDDDDGSIVRDAFPPATTDDTPSSSLIEDARRLERNPERPSGVCRVCLHDVFERDLELGLATAFGCACVDAFIHLSDGCSDAYVDAKNPRCDTVCEVCLSPAYALNARVAIRRKLARERAQRQRDEAEEPTTLVEENPPPSPDVAVDEETGSMDTENPNRPPIRSLLHRRRRASSSSLRREDRFVECLCVPCVAGFACIACVHRCRFFLVFTALVSIGLFIVIQT